MGEAQSKRLRLRLFPGDEDALNEALRLTTHTSKSNVIRAALSFFGQVWSSAQGGFRVVLFREDSAERPNVLDFAVLPGPSTDADAAPPQAKRHRTDKSMEIRVTPSDVENIEALRASEAADTNSEVVRRSIRLYARVISQCRQGWDVIALSPSGDVLPLTVPGLGTQVAGPARPVEKMPAVSISQRPPLPAADNGGGVTRIWDLLPGSLADLVRELAEKETCPPEALLADMLRAEALRRLEMAGSDAGARETESVAPVSLEERPSEIAEDTAPAEPASEQHEADEGVVAEIASTLDQMADSIEKIMRLMGEANQSKGEQADFADLLFSSATEESPDEMPAQEPASALAQLSKRAQELNGRLTTLVALSEGRKKSKRSRRSPSAAAKSEAAERQETQAKLGGEATDTSGET